MTTLSTFYLFKQEILDYIQIYCMDFTDYPKKGKKHDLIFMQNILCHFEDPTLEETFIRKAYKLLIPGGYLVCGGRSEKAGEVLKALGFIPVVEKMKEIWNSWKGFTPWAKPCLIEGSEDPFFISSIFRKAK